MAKLPRTISRWGLLMIGESGPIISGCEGVDLYRTSTPLVQFDVASLTGVTAAGRPYRLVGSSDPGYAMAAFRSLWNPGDAVVRDVTPEEAAELAQRNAPAVHTPEEQARASVEKLQHYAFEMRRHMRLYGLNEAEAASRAGLTEDQLAGMLEEDLGRISGDEADAAFVRLMEASGDVLAHARII